MSRDASPSLDKEYYELTGSVCSRSCDRLGGDASAHSALAGIHGQRGVILLFNPRLNLSIVATTRSLGKNYYQKIFI